MNSIFKFSRNNITTPGNARLRNSYRFWKVFIVGQHQASLRYVILKAYVNSIINVESTVMLAAHAAPLNPHPKVWMSVWHKKKWKGSIRVLMIMRPVVYPVVISITSIESTKESSKHPGIKT